MERYIKSWDKIFSENPENTAIIKEHRLLTGLQLFRYRLHLEPA